MNCETLWLAKRTVPVELIVMSVELLYWSRLRKTWAELVVKDDADEVGTTLKVNVGPVTPLMVEVAGAAVR